MRRASTLRFIFAAFSRPGYGIRGSALFSTGQTIAKRPLGNSGRRARVVFRRRASKICSRSPVQHEWPSRVREM
jgi:hypothetical protein